MYCITTPQRVRPAPKRRADAPVRFYLRSDQIGLSLPSPPRHCACGMGIVHAADAGGFGQSGRSCQRTESSPGGSGGLEWRCLTCAYSVWPCMEERERESASRRTSGDVIEHDEVGQLCRDSGGASACEPLLCIAQRAASDGHPPVHPPLPPPCAPRRRNKLR